MMDRELAFSTFLKLLELPEGQKTTALRGFLRGGGFNYWRPLQMLAPDVASGKLAPSDIPEMVGAMSKSHQRKYNEKALTNLMMWFSRRKIQIRKKPPRLIKKFGNSGLKVRLEPEIAFAMDGREYFMHVWATNNPTLSEETLSMGLYFFRLHYLSEGYKDVQFLIFDTVKDRIFAEFNVLVTANDKLSEQRKVLSSLWSEVNGEGVGERKQPEDRPSEGPEDRPTSPH